jgi:NMD protein affecting ribosome stability and mRNA decay
MQHIKCPNCGKDISRPIYMLAGDTFNVAGGSLFTATKATMVYYCHECKYYRISTGQEMSDEGCYDGQMATR